jgi:predicted transcriptional regulator
MAVKAVKSHILEDLEYDKKLLKALKRVLAYHMTHDEYKVFIQETK